MKVKKFRKSTTLLEMFITIAILSMVLGGMLLVLNFGNLSWQVEAGLLSINQQLRQSMDGISREIRQADPATIVISNGGARIDFSIPQISNAVSFYLSGDQVIREHPVGTTTILLNDVNFITFTSVGGTIQIQIGATKVVRQRNLVVTLTQKVGVRNE